MALKNKPINTTFFLLIFLAIFIISSESKLGELVETRLSFYFQDYPSGPNATALPIVGIPGKNWTYDSFGTVFCADDIMTQGFDKSSAQVARGQAIFVTTAKDGSSVTLLLSIVFTNKEYNGSTLQIQGADHQFENPREVAVVGGTGKFRFARGYATFETFHIARYYDVVRCNVTVQHY